VAGGGPASGARWKSLPIESLSSRSTAWPSGVSVTETSSLPTPAPIGTGPLHVTPSSDVNAHVVSATSSEVS
jgi:hypothetical protein